MEHRCIGRDAHPARTTDTPNRVEILINVPLSDLTADLRLP